LRTDRRHGQASRARTLGQHPDPHDFEAARCDPVRRSHPRSVSELSLTGLAGLESVSASDFFSGGSRYFTTGPTISWRLFEGGRIRANIEVQNAREEQALHQYEKAVLTGLRDVEDSLVAYGKERVRHDSLAGAVEANHRSVVLARDLYVHGLGTYLAVPDAERTAYTADDALAQGDESLVANLIATYKALGGGWELADDAGAHRS